MYRPTGLTADLGDVEIIEKDGMLHLFHLVIPNRDKVEHVVSKDGMSWQVLPAAICTGAPGDADDDMIRTVSVTLHRGTYYMLYAATMRQDRGRVERICLATSTDLMNWTKHPDNPVMVADGIIYDAAPLPGAGVSWRDPKTYYEDGVYYCLLCARRAGMPALRNGCVALATSEDMVHWAIEEPLFAPACWHDIECPQLYKIGGYYYLIGAIIEDQSQRYWVSENLRGPYQTPGDNLLVPPGSHYAGRMGSFAGRDVFACWNASVEDGQNPVGVVQNPGRRVRNIPALLDVVQQGRRIWLSPGKNWESYARKPVKDAYTGCRPLCGRGQAKQLETGLALSCPEGMEIAAGGELVGNFELTATLSVSAARGGIAFCLEEDTSGYFVEFHPENQTAKLVKHLPPAGDPWRGFLYEKRQLAHLPGYDFDALDITLRNVEGEIELSVAGKLKLCTFSFARLQGLLGIFAECGDVGLCNAQVCRMARIQ